MQGCLLLTLDLLSTALGAQTRSQLELQEAVENTPVNEQSFDLFNKTRGGHLQALGGERLAILARPQTCPSACEAEWFVGLDDLLAETLDLLTETVLCPN